MWPIKKKHKKFEAFGRVELDKEFIKTHCEKECLDALRDILSIMRDSMYNYLSCEIKNYKVSP